MKSVLKVIQLHTDEEKLIRKAQRKDRASQHALYSKYAPKMLSICRYYISDLHFAEDVMITGFAKVFQYLDSFRFDGSFEGWVRRIMVREAISHLRTKKEMKFTEDENIVTDPVFYDIDLTADTLQFLIDRLPDGYKTVFVMFGIEGYSHKEIAELLGITEGTSKSQLAKARKLLQQQLELITKKENGTI